MQPIDQYILARAADLTAKIRKAYDEMEFHRVYHLLNEFLNSELSAFYLDVLKDRLYTFPVAFRPGHDYQRDLYIARRSAQTAIYKITDALARLTAPILSFTADEVWESIPGKTGSVHLTLFPKPEDLAPIAHTSKLIADWEKLLDVRVNILRQLETMRTSKEIGKALDAELQMLYDTTNLDEEGRTLLKYADSLPELLGLSQVRVRSVAGIPEVVASYSVGHPVVSTAPKCSRCWRHVPDVGGNANYPTVCLRCAEALDAIDFPPYAATQ